MSSSRRVVIRQLAAAGFYPLIAGAGGGGRNDHGIRLIAAPTNLGLRPRADGSLPGTWRMPEVLMEAGLATALHSLRPRLLPSVAYDTQEQIGTRIRNGNSIRSQSLILGGEVQRALHAGEFPVVLGGDCSVMLGCLLGLRWAGGRGLIHVDGHSDFFHPGNYDTTKRLGSAAGMDLALATGRGEPVLTQWPNLGDPLASDEDTVQIGERNAKDPSYLTEGYGDIIKTAITRVTIQHIQRDGLETMAALVVARLEQRRITRAWVHIDLDVLDQSVLPAVDSPGSPGLTSDELLRLLRSLTVTRRVAGVDFAIYDPELDPQRRYPGMLVECIVNGLAAPSPGRISSQPR